MCVSCLCSYSAVGRRDRGSLSSSGRRLEEDTDLSEGASVRQENLCCYLHIKPMRCSLIHHTKSSINEIYASDTMVVLSHFKSHLVATVWHVGL